MIKCRTCRFYSKPILEMSTCKRYPPTIFKPYAEGYSPIVSADDWCGEYKPRKIDNDKAS